MCSSVFYIPINLPCCLAILSIYNFYKAKLVISFHLLII